MPDDSWLLRLADLAADQGGLLTTAQARAAGVSPQQVARLARTGVLEPVVHGVHRLAGAAPDRLGGLRAVWLALEPSTVAGARVSREDPSGVVSHRSAAVVHGLGDVEADVNQFTVGVRRRSRNPEVRLHTAALDRGSWTVVSGLPVTTVARTIADLASIRTDGGHLARVVSDGLSGLQVGLEEVASVLRPFAHYYGAPLGGGAELVDQFLVEAGIPEATTALARAAVRTTGGWAPAPIELGVAPVWARELQRSLVEVSASIGQVDTNALREALTSIQLVTDAARVVPQLNALRLNLGEGLGAELARVIQDAARAQVLLPTGPALTPRLIAALPSQLPHTGPVEDGAPPAEGQRRGGQDVEDA